MMRKGVTPHYAAEAYRSTVTHDALTILAPCHPIRQRGDTLTGPALTVVLSSPMPDVIRVRISHFEGGLERGPNFELFEAPGAIEVNKSSLTVGALTVRIPENGWALEFSAEGRALTRSPCGTAERTAKACASVRVMKPQGDVSGRAADPASILSRREYF